MTNRIRALHEDAVRILVLLALCSSAGCTSDESTDARRNLERLSIADTPEDSVSRVIAEASVRCSARWPTPAADPTQYLSTEFTLWNAADPSDTLPRDFRGRQTLGLDYFEALSTRLTPEHAQVERLEILPERAGEVVVIATHRSPIATITVWQQLGGTWQATRLTINEPDTSIAAIRAAYVSDRTR